MNKKLILALNLNMQFTRIAVYNMNTLVFLKKINHNPEELQGYKYFCDQAGFRAKIVIDELVANDIDLGEIRVVIGRGGLLKPVKSGIYRVGDAVVKDLSNPKMSNDAVNLGGLLAFEIAKQIPSGGAYIADPVVVDELDDIARITGRPEFKKKSIFHALNQKTCARKYAATVYKDYGDLNLIVAHLGGGISVGAHRKGRVVDTNQAYDGDGPFSPIRSGSLPMGDVIRQCYSGKYSCEEMLRMQTGEGGLYAYFKTYRGYDVCKMRDEGNQKAAEVLSAMAYQVARAIGSMYPVFENENVDAIIITGGMAKDDKFVSEIKNRVEKIAPVTVLPGAEVLGALSYYGRLILLNEAEIFEYN